SAPFAANSPVKLPISLSVAAPPKYALTILGSGRGAGTVTVMPGGARCDIIAGVPSGAGCVTQVDSGVAFTLEALPNAGSDFTGWGGDCTGASGATCALAMSRALTPNAAFAAIPQCTITTSSPLPQATVGASYCASLATSCGSAVWYLASGSMLPAGLQLNGGTGVITGVPTAVGVSTFTVEAAVNGQTPATQFSLTVVVPPVDLVAGPVSVTPANPTTSQAVSLSATMINSGTV